MFGLSGLGAFAEGAAKGYREVKAEERLDAAERRAEEHHRQQAASAKLLQERAEMEFAEAKRRLAAEEELRGATTKAYRDREEALAASAAPAGIAAPAPAQPAAPAQAPRGLQMQYAEPQSNQFGGPTAPFAPPRPPPPPPPATAAGLGARSAAPVLVSDKDIGVLPSTPNPDVAVAPVAPVGLAPAAAPAQPQPAPALAARGITGPAPAPQAAPGAGLPTAPMKPAPDERTDHQFLRDLSRITRDIKLKHGMMTAEDAAKGDKYWDMLEKEGVVDGMRYFAQTGDRAGAIKMINSTGSIKLDPNAKFEVKDEEYIKGTGQKHANVYITSPDGKVSMNMFGSMLAALNPKEYGDHLVQAGKAASEAGYRNEMAEHYRRADKELAEHHREMAERAKQQTEAILQMKKDNFDQKMYAKATADFGRASNSIAAQLGYNYKADTSLFDPDQLTEHKSKGILVGDASNVFALNYGDKGPSVSPAEAVQIRQQIGKSIPIDSIKLNDGVLTTKWNGKEIQLPNFNLAGKDLATRVQDIAKENSNKTAPAAPATTDKPEQKRRALGLQGAADRYKEKRDRLSFARGVEADESLYPPPETMPSVYQRRGVSSRG